MMVAWKGWRLMLEALTSMPESQRERFRFTHIGSAVDSPASRGYAAELRARTTALGLDGIVDWRGEQETSADLLQEIDVLVVPSSAEPFSVVMLEALRAGVPVLASRAGGPTDVLQPPRNGWFFAPEDSADLARALIELIESDALDRVEIKANDLEPFSAERVAAQWADIYAARVDAK
jgi:glycosyltransferase involved in cell wall biosynthesis